MEQKEQLLLDILQRIAHLSPQCILPALRAPSTWHYRNKARLSVRFVRKKQAILIGFRERNNARYITVMDDCMVLNRKVSDHMAQLRAVLEQLSNPEAIVQIEVAAGDQAVALILRNVMPLTADDHAHLIAFAQQYGFTVYLQPAAHDSLVLLHAEDMNIGLTYESPEHAIKYHFQPMDFTQINSALNRCMINQVITCLELSPQDRILDLFCGLGNFSLPIARYSAAVIGVEGNAAMVARAHGNASLNNINNAQFYTADLTQVNILQQWADLSINKILLDPPRSGALEIVQQIEQINPELIVYISCNPATLARDLDCLVHTKGYILRAVGVMDMFPHTTHVESIAVLGAGCGQG